MSLSPRRTSTRFVTLRTLGWAALALGLSACKVAGGPFVTIQVSALPVETKTLLVKASFSGQEKTQQFATTGENGGLPLTFELPNGASGPLAVHAEASDGTCVLASGDASVEITADAAYDSAIALQPQPLAGCSFLTYSLRVTVMSMNNATGSVTSDVPGIDCGTRCTAEFRPNTAVTLRATAPVGMRVGSWSEPSCNTGFDPRTCTLQLSAKKDVTVTFDSCTGNWCEEVPGTSNNSLRAIFGTAANQIYAAGDGPTLLRYDGTAWRTEVLPATAKNLRGVTSLRSPVFPVVVGEQGTLLHNGAGGWYQNVTTNLPATQQINAVAGFDIGSLYVIGNGGFIRYFHPTNIIYVPVTRDPGSSGAFPPTANLNAIAPITSASPRHFIVGDFGYCAIGEPTDTKGKYKLTEQTSVCGAQNKNLYGVWFGSAIGMLVGDGGTAIRYNGLAYTATPTGITTALRAAFGLSDTQIYAVGDGGVILRYNGTAWMPEASHTTKDLNGIWGLPTGHLYAVGQGGTIMHYYP